MSKNSQQVSEYALARQGSALQTKQSGPTEIPTDGDFKSYVLYIHSGEKRTPYCLQALEALTANPKMKLDTLIQDVDALPTRPVWLETVPCIVIKSEKRALKESAAIDYIKSCTVKGGVNYAKRGQRAGHPKTRETW
jgi:hypothetical protein